MSHETPMDEWVAYFEAGKRPLDGLIARSIRELSSSDYSVCGIHYANNVREVQNVRPELLRIVLVAGENLKSVILPPKNDPMQILTDVRIMNSLGTELPFDTSDYEQFEQKALGALSEEGHIAVAAMTWGHSGFGQVSVQIAFPKVFMGLMPLYEKDKVPVALRIAGHFIQKTSSSGPGREATPA